MFPHDALPSESTVPRSWEAVSALLLEHGFIELAADAEDEAEPPGEIPRPSSI
jgi:hypothetical protein